MTDILITVLGIFLIIMVWVMLYDSNRFVVQSTVVSDRRIRKPLRAVVIADLHNKRYGRENERLLNEIRARKPDVILIAGDILTAKPGKSIQPAISFLEVLAKEFPVYYGNGNHEHRLKLYPKKYGDMGKQYWQALHDMGIEPMVNSHVVLEDCGLAIYGAEIEKVYYKRFKTPKMGEEYMGKILGKADERYYTVLLAHNPDYFPQYVGWGADLTLSGHVHGGVVRVPLWGKGLVSPSLKPFPKYDGGIFRQGQAVMILSRGLGMHTIPVRVFNPGELWVVDFQPE